MENVKYISRGRGVSWVIARKHRFHGHGSLRFVYKHGRTVRGQMFSLKYISNDRRSVYRLAVVVSKKVSKSAVIRNRIRRRLYEIVRRYEQSIEKPYDLVLTVFSEQLAIIPAEELEKAIINLLKQAKII